jgi:hypothetical protein
MSAFGPSDARPLRPEWALTGTGACGRKRNVGFRDTDRGKLPSVGIGPADLFRPASLVDTVAASHAVHRKLQRRKLFDLNPIYGVVRDKLAVREAQCS